MIVVSKINYVAEDLGLEIYMDSGIMIKVWSENDDDSRKVFNDFTARLKASITNGMKFAVWSTAVFIAVSYCRTIIIRRYFRRLENG